MFFAYNVIRCDFLEQNYGITKRWENGPECAPKDLNFKAAN